MYPILVVVAVTALAVAVSSTRHLTPVHVVFLTDCTKYSNWQSIGDTFSFKMSGQPGTVSRVMCCTPEEKAQYDESLKNEVETWIAPSFAIHPKTGDNYAAYNKPEAVIDWLENQTPKEDYVLVLDSDMTLRRPFLVEDMKPSPGWAIGARYTYMIGVANELADRHIPEIPKRNDTFAGPFGRRADQVGGFFFVDRNDLKRMSHGWLKYSEDVRADPEAYRLSGDVYAIHPGDKPWISEMYGYAFGAATAGVWHHWDPISMIYPGYEPMGIPKLMHYGLLFEFQGYKFDKHWHYDFDVTQCPPWDLNTDRVKAGVFQPPPHPSTFTNKDGKAQYYRDLLAVETVATLNAGFCDYHLRHCPPSKQLLDVCTKAVHLYMDVVKEVEVVEKDFKCVDRHVKCELWAKAGECENNSDYMRENCPKSCGACHSISENAPRNMPNDTLLLLDELKASLATDTTTKPVTTTPTTTTAAAVPTSKGGDPDGHAADPDVAAASKKIIIPHTDPHHVANIVRAVSPPTEHLSPPAEHLSPAKDHLSPAEEHISPTEEHVSPPAEHVSPQAKHVSPTDVHRSPTHKQPSANSPIHTTQPQLTPEEHDSVSPTIDSGTHLRAATLDNNQVVKGSTKPRKDLLIRCYRLSVGPEAVKSCVAAANRGQEWEPERKVQPASGTADDADDTKKHATGDGTATDHDTEDLRQLEEQLADPPKTGDALPNHATGGIGIGGLAPTLAALSTWQAVGLWACLLAVLLMCVPRVLRMRRRPRSGMRSE